MSAQPAGPKMKASTVQPKKLTVEDIRRKAERIQEVARDDVQHVIRADRTRVVIYAAAGVAVAVGVAYYLGTRAGRRRVAARSTAPE
ncbi:MAG TPA: hypothetical protein VGK50_06955 [Coriobacteriia bacterium]|jgi:hypothetical protein